MMLRKIRMKIWCLYRDLVRRSPQLPISEKGKLRIVCLHGICADNQPFINGRFCKIGQLKTLLNLLSTHVHFLSFEEWYNDRYHPDKLNVLLTFDDGYRNNLTVLLPVLEMMQIPAVVCVTGRSDSPLWTDLFDIACAEKLIDTDTFTSLGFAPGLSLKALKIQLTKSPPEIIDHITEMLRNRIPEDVMQHYAVFHELLTDDELKVLKNSLLQPVSHTANHYSLPQLTPSQLRIEIEMAEQRLRLAGFPDVQSKTVAIPFSHRNKAVSDQLRTFGIHKQLTGEEDTSDEKDVYARMTVNPFISARNMAQVILEGRYPG